MTKAVFKNYIGYYIGAVVILLHLAGFIFLITHGLGLELTARDYVLSISALIAFSSIVISQVWMDSRQRRDHKHDWEREGKAKLLDKKEEIVILLGEVQFNLSLLNGQVAHLSQLALRYGELISPDSESEKLRDKIWELIKDEISKISSSKMLVLDKFSLTLKLLEMYFLSHGIHEKGYKYSDVLLEINNEVIDLINNEFKTTGFVASANKIKIDIDRMLIDLAKTSLELVNLKCSNSVNY